MNTPVHFKQQLADELHARASALPTPRGHRTRVQLPRPRLTFALGAVTAAAAVAVAVPVALSGPSPSDAPAPHRAATSSSIDIVTATYTVKSVPNGTIAVRLMDAKGIPGLQDALRQAGVPAAVMAYSPSCTTTVDRDNTVDSQKVFPESADGRDTLIRLSAVPKGEHLLVTPTPTPNGGIGGLALSVVRHIPDCVPASDNGIGAGYVTPGTNP
ncbi:hypothetical protein OG897_17210 [Streptomyces sp. NBC_00237]|uniref:hypothetical protein n=1 Tax=Streptomyces sp. NBC_00237 TaxID=2975687 RepID=UPI002252AB07|nr:hypothetical protein [Streptomyces sp. NBC_00237]MCX5203180.1 hypothetical protein [Streptomyces sp. NBC_00237]